MIQLSIIVPVYNVEKYIRACLESVFKQGLNDDCFEVIIVNDGTNVILSEDFIDSYPFTVNYFINEHLGVSGTRDICF